MGELIVYQFLRHPSTFSNIFSSETTGLIELKFPLDGRAKVCSNGPGHMNKMSTMLIYGKYPLKSSPYQEGR